METYSVHTTRIGLSRGRNSANGETRSLVDPTGPVAVLRTASVTELHFYPGAVASTAVNFGSRHWRRTLVQTVKSVSPCTFSRASSWERVTQNEGHSFLTPRRVSCCCYFSLSFLSFFLSDFVLVGFVARFLSC